MNFPSPFIKDRSVCFKIMPKDRRSFSIAESDFVPSYLKLAESIRRLSDEAGDLASDLSSDTVILSLRGLSTSQLQDFFRDIALSVNEYLAKRGKAKMKTQDRITALSSSLL